jgi:hypothetical protein
VSLDCETVPCVIGPPHVFPTLNGRLAASRGCRNHKTVVRSRLRVMSPKSALLAIQRAIGCWTSQQHRAKPNGCNPTELEGAMASITIQRVVDGCCICASRTKPNGEERMWWTGTKWVGNADRSQASVFVSYQQAHKAIEKAKACLPVAWRSQLA